MLVAFQRRLILKKQLLLMVRFTFLINLYESFKVHLIHFILGLQIATSYSITLSFLDEKKSNKPIAITSIPVKTNECKFFVLYNSKGLSDLVMWLDYS